MSALRPIQLVIPMAGLGTRFTAGGYTEPKPLLKIHGLAMYRLVMANLLSRDVGRVVIICQRSWKLSESIVDLRDALDVEIELIEIDYVTGGPADTVQLAEGWLRPDDPVVTANSDQYVAVDIRSFYSTLQTGRVAGALLLMEDDHPKWSYAHVDDEGYVTEVREKVVISPYATVGIYGFHSAELMFEAFDAMRSQSDHVNGEFYVGPAYNYLKPGDLRVASINLGPVATVMHGMGTPEDFELFLTSGASVLAVEGARRLGMPL
jgi:NDP-sugar pyrophosphorylase family protein